MRIPSTLSLAAVQSSLKDVQSAIRPLETGLIELKGGRVTGAGKPINGFDYVRKYDLDIAVRQIQTALDELKSKVSDIEEQLGGSWEYPLR